MNICFNLKSIAKSIAHLNIKKLCLSDEFSYSYLDAEELQASLTEFIDSCKNKGLTTLEVRDSKCQFCFPNLNAYSFHNPKNGDFLTRYVIGQKSETEFIVEECKNKPIQGDKGLPF